jgi:hypothetical protein
VVTAEKQELLEEAQSLRRKQAQEAEKERETFQASDKI